MNIFVDILIRKIKKQSFQGGVYIFQLMDFYSASGMSILWVCFFQTIAISWIFGAKKFCDCIHQMMGIRLNNFWYICWVVFAPVIMAVSIAFRISSSVTIFVQFLKKKKGQIFLSLSVHLRIPMRSIQTSEIRKQLRISDVGGGDRRLSQFVIHDLDPCLRHILRGRHARVHKRGEILFLVNLVIWYRSINFVRVQYVQKSSIRI